jgi:hypothetical protein
VKRWLAWAGFIGPPPHGKFGAVAAGLSFHPVKEALANIQAEILLNTNVKKKKPSSVQLVIDVNVAPVSVSLRIIASRIESRSLIWLYSNPMCLI